MITNAELNAGLSDETLAVIDAVLAKYPSIVQVKLYGSRAKGNFTERSDIDLVAYGEQIDRSTIAAVLLDLDDSSIPWLVDLQNYNELKNYQLIEHIDRVGKVIYQSNRASF